MITLRCLGPLEVSLDGGEPPAELLWRKNLALLVYLARSPRGRTRDHLVGAFWPDKDDAKARHSLNEALRVLRRSLGSSLATDGDTIRIAPGAVSTDTDRLEQLPAAQLGLPFLEGFALADAPEFENWMGAERAALEPAQLAALGRQADAALAEGAAHSAADLAMTALRLSPRHEPSARIVMKAHAIGGQRALALEVCDRLSAALGEVGLEPDASTRALAERIRTERIRAAAPAAAAAAQDEARAALVGKARAQLGSLASLWSNVQRGGARTAVLLGDPGTGKTRLAEELAARARLDGAVVTRVRAVAGEPARETWSALLRGGLEVPELAGAAAPALAALIALDPDIALRFPAARGGSALTAREGLLTAIGAIAEARAVLIVLDDAHHAASDVLEDLGILLDRLKDLPVMLFVAAARAPSPAVDALAQRVGRDLAGEVIATVPLAEAEVAELVRSTFPRHQEAQQTRLARRVFADTAGNPFLVVELIRALRDGLTLPEGAPPGWPAAHRTLDDTRPGDLPQSVAAALRLRFRALSDAAQQVLAAAAVLGDGTPAATLGRATGLERGSLEKGLDELEWTRWLVADSRGYGFATSIAREVVLADMVTGGQQRRIRERIEGE